MATTIGKLIEKEVRQQGWNITSFANEICCTRTNVYDIFQRSKMDVAQLQLISRVLGHNFFMDLANNPELADASNPEIEKDLMNRKAVAQFFDVMPKVLKSIGIETCIVMPIMQNKYNDPLPDYGFSDYSINFTVGERLFDRFDKERLFFFDVKTDKTPNGQIIDIWHNKVHETWTIDIKLDYKTEEEWRDLILYVFENHDLIINSMIK